MLVRIAELEIEPDRFAEYTLLLREEIDSSIRLEPGVHFLFAVALKESPHSVRVVEGYADQAAYEAHLATPHFLTYKAATAGMVKSLRLLETDPIALGAKNLISS